MCASHRITILHFPRFQHLNLQKLDSGWVGRVSICLTDVRLLLCCCGAEMKNMLHARRSWSLLPSCRPGVQGRRWFQLWMALPGPWEQARGENGPGKCLTPPLTCRLCISKSTWNTVRPRLGALGSSVRLHRKCESCAAVTRVTPWRLREMTEVPTSSDIICGWRAKAGLASAGQRLDLLGNDWKCFIYVNTGV